jgi:hypothetical protein
MWYNESTLDAIHASNIVTRSMMTAGGKVFDDNNEYCSRGLLTRTESRKRRDSGHNALIAVLRVQELQYDLGIEDDELLAGVCCESSRQSHLEALQRGVQDRKEVIIGGLLNEKRALSESLTSSTKKVVRVLAARQA